MRKNKLDRKGSVLIFVAISMAVLVGFAGLALDIGMSVYKKSRLQNAADSAALAAAQELPDSTSMAESIAADYMQANIPGIDTNSYEVTFSESDRKVRVDARMDVDYLFAKVIGFQKGEVVVSAAAIKAPAASSKTIRPFGVDANEYGANGVGKPVTLRFGAGDGSSGNFGALDFGRKHKDEGYQVGLGADFFEDMIMDGSYIYYGVEEEVPTLTGIMAQKTLDAVTYLVEEEGVTEIVVPLIENVNGGPLDLSGKTPVRIVGFVSVEINSYAITSASKPGKGEGSGKKGGGTGQLEINGVFGETQTIGHADLNTTNTGVSAVSLVE